MSDMATLTWTRESGTHRAEHEVSGWHHTHVIYEIEPNLQSGGGWIFKVFTSRPDDRTSLLTYSHHVPTVAAGKAEADQDLRFNEAARDRVEPTTEED